MRSEPGEDYSPTKFSIAEVQGDRSSRKCQLIVCVRVLYHALLIN